MQRGSSGYWNVSLGLHLSKKVENHCPRELSERADAQIWPGCRYFMIFKRTSCLANEYIFNLRNGHNCSQNSHNSPISKNLQKQSFIVRCGISDIPGQSFFAIFGISDTDVLHQSTRAAPNNSKQSLVRKRGHVRFDARAQVSFRHGVPSYGKTFVKC